LKLLQYSKKDKTATELAQELDVSWQKIGWIAKKIEEDYYYLKKEQRKGRKYYILSDLGREYLNSITP
jgi:predicted transcriptional regulator